MINKNKNNNRLFVARSVLSIFLSLFLLSNLGGTSQAATSDVAKWFTSASSLEEGTIVSIDATNADAVTVASMDQSTKLLGVVVSSGNATISLDGSTQEGKVQVAIAGRAQVKVDKSNGPISRGDLIGLSKVSGIGAKANEGEPVVGVAESSFGSEGDSSSEETILLPMIVSVGVAPSSSLAQGATSTTWVRSIAGRDVSALQLFFVFFIAAVGVIAISFLSYSAVKSGVTATGRNPLAKPAILRALSQTMIMVSLVAISCFSLMYFMLRL